MSQHHASTVYKWIPRRHHQCRAGIRRNHLALARSFSRKWALAYKVARDAEMLRNAPREVLEDIGIDRKDVAFVCEHGHLPR